MHPEELNIEVLRQVKALYPHLHNELPLTQRELVERVQKFVLTGVWK